jgi:hypothetical protein
MRPSILLGLLLLSGCAMATEPSHHLELGVIAGFFHDDPFVEVRTSGTSAVVTVTTFGSSCNAKGVTRVTMDGLTATIMPFNHAPPAGTPCPRDLRSFVHEATVGFDRSGTARIRVRGIDGRTRSAANLIGDTITVERTVTIPAP